MDRKQLHGLLIERVAPRSVRLGLSAKDMTEDLDLVRTGLLDSLGFVDLITELETAVGHQVELEQAFDRPGATTVGGVLDLFLDRR
ncbi:MAG TPA: acyl carrier protein [Flavobacteriales bacterium]